MSCKTVKHALKRRRGSGLLGFQSENSQKLFHVTTKISQDAAGIKVLKKARSKLPFFFTQRGIVHWKEKNELVARISKLPNIFNYL